jgi:MFS family permease
MCLNISDRRGRILAFYLSIQLLLVSTIVLYWVNNFAEYLVVRFFTGAGCAGIFLVGFVIG